jgi:hypothetical protein
MATQSSGHGTRQISSWRIRRGVSHPSIGMGSPLAFSRRPRLQWDDLPVVFPPRSSRRYMRDALCSTDSGCSLSRFSH